MKKMLSLLSLALALTLICAMFPTMVLADGGYIELFQIKNGTLVWYSGADTDTPVIIPNTVTEIGERALSGRSLSSIVIPNSVTSIGSHAFSDNSGLTSMVIPSSVVKIGQGAFWNCSSLTSMTIPNSIIELGDEMFGNCTALTTVVIQANITRIGKRMFSRCTSLTNVTIPNSVTKIDNSAFEHCSGLKDIYFAGSEAQWKTIEINNDWDGNMALASATIHYNSTGPTETQQPATAQAAPTNDTLTVDGKVQAPTVYKIDGANYFKIRDLAAVLNGSAKQFEVGYDGASKSVTATSGQPYTSVGGELAGAASSAQTAAVSSDKIIINGRTVEAQVYKIAGSNYFKLRDLGRALDFYVGYEKGKGMFIETDKPYTE